jgi:hypothetical protein
LDGDDLLACLLEHALGGLAERENDGDEDGGYSGEEQGVLDGGGAPLT